MKNCVKILALVMCMVLLAGVVTGCGGGKKAASDSDVAADSAPSTAAATNDPSTDTDVPEEEADTEDTADADRIFVMGFDAEFPPYGYKDESGEYKGFDIELATELCARRGWELQLQPIDWSAKDAQLQSGAIDCVWNGFTMNGREDQYTWTDAYLDNYQVFVVAEDAGIAETQDLAGKIVAVQADSSAEKALDEPEQAELKDSFAELRPIADYTSAMMELEAGSVEAVAMDSGVAEYLIKQRGGGFVILEEQLAKEEYGIGFRRGNDELRDEVQLTLLEMVEDGKFEEIADGWGLAQYVVLGK